MGSGSGAAAARVEPSPQGLAQADSTARVEKLEGLLICKRLQPRTTYQKVRDQPVVINHVPNTCRTTIARVAPMGQSVTDANRLAAILPGQAGPAQAVAKRVIFGSVRQFGTRSAISLRSES